MNPMMNTSFAAPPPPQQQQQPFQPPPSYSAAPPPPPTQFTPPPAPAQMSAPAMPPPPTNPRRELLRRASARAGVCALAAARLGEYEFLRPASVGAPGGSTNSYDPYGGGGRRESEVPKPPPVTSFAPSEMEYDDAPVQSAYSTGASAPQHGGGGMNQSFQQ